MLQMAWGDFGEVSGWICDRQVSRLASVASCRTCRSCEAISYALDLKESNFKSNAEKMISRLVDVEL